MSGYDVSQVPLPDPEADQEPVRLSFREQQEAKLAEILECGSGWTPAEQWVVRCQFRLLGDFGAAFARALTLADEANLERLRLGFPAEVEGLLAWREGGLVGRLRATGLEI